MAAPSPTQLKYLFFITPSLVSTSGYPHIEANRTWARFGKKPACQDDR